MIEEFDSYVIRHISVNNDTTEEEIRRFLGVKKTTKATKGLLNY